MKKQILIAGGRSKAKSLALSLKEKGFLPVLLNWDFHECEHLAEMSGIKVICADATCPDVLQNLSSASFCKVIALCPRDEDNLMICRLSRMIFPEAMTISMVSDLNKKPFFEQSGADKVICPAAALTALVENEAFVESVGQLTDRPQNRVHLLEMDVTSNDFAVYKRLWQLNLPQGVIIGCILRHDAMIIPHGETRILAGDHLVLMMSENQEKRVWQMIKGGAGDDPASTNTAIH